jgi:hypothetical protein
LVSRALFETNGGKAKPTTHTCLMAYSEYNSGIYFQAQKEELCRRNISK